MRVLATFFFSLIVSSVNCFRLSELHLERRYTVSTISGGAIRSPLFRKQKLSATITDDDDKATGWTKPRIHNNPVVRSVVLLGALAAFQQIAFYCSSQRPSFVLCGLVRHRLLYYLYRRVDHVQKSTTADFRASSKQAVSQIFFLVFVDARVAGELYAVEAATGTAWIVDSTFYFTCLTHLV